MFSTGPYKYNRFNLLEKQSKPDFLDMDKDGDKKESMKKAIKEKSGNCPDGKCGKCDKCKEKKEEFTASVKALIDEGTDFSGYTWDELYEGYISEGLPPALLKAIMKKKGGDTGSKEKEGKKCTKEDIGQYLMDKGYANNPVSAEVIIEHMSQEWLDQILEENN